MAEAKKRDRIKTTDGYITWAIFYTLAIPLAASFYISRFVKDYFVLAAIFAIVAIRAGGGLVVVAILLAMTPYILTGWWLERYNRQEKINQAAKIEALFLLWPFIYFIALKRGI